MNSLFIGAFPSPRCFPTVIGTSLELLPKIYRSCRQNFIGFIPKSTTEAHLSLPCHRSHRRFRHLADDWICPCHLWFLPLSLCLFSKLLPPKRLPPKRLLWVLLHLIHRDNVLFSMNFSNGIRIVRSLVLLLLHSQEHLLRVSLIQLPLVLGF